MIGLNPSRADAKINDPTVKKEYTWAFDQGYTEYIKLNLFDIISPYPKDLLIHEKPCGKINRALLRNIPNDFDVVAAWGRIDKRIMQHAFIPNRDLFCFYLNADGSPRHPLYLAYKEMKLRPWINPYL